METFGQALRRLRKSVGLSQPGLARQVPVDQSTLSRWENGRIIPDSASMERLDQLLNARGQLASFGAPAALTVLDPPPDTAEPVTADYIDWLRHSITHLVTLDGQHGGAELAPMAARLFRTASGRLASGEYSQAIERDFAAVVAELGEVAGWLAFDALQHEQARSLNLESLHLARLAGDRDMELFLLGNMAMQAQETGRPRETLRTVQLMETFNLSPRMRIMTGIRRARAAADLGDERAFEVLHRAQSDLSSSVHRTEPSWAWWINATEVQSHEGGVWRAIGERSQAVDCYSAALESIAPRYRWGRFITGANLINALVEVADWPEAERIAAEVYTLASEVSSARAMHRIRTAADTAYRSGAPSTLEGMLTALARRTT